MTISAPDGVSPTEEQFYRSSNFRFTIRNGVNKQKKHTNGEWSTSKSLNLSANTSSEEIKIVLNPDYESMKDFAYYGSAVDMVKASIVDIVLRFPAELYFTKEKIKIDNLSGDTNVSGLEINEWYLVSNDFAIDIYTKNVKEDVDNELRYMSKSFNKYRVYNDSTIGDECACEISITSETPSCYDTQVSGAVIARVEISMGEKYGNGGSRTPVKPIVVVYKLGDDVYYLYRDISAIGYHVVPDAKIVDEFYDGLDDFERVLLNRDSKPQYTATFDTPYETDEGYFTYKRKYTWPSTYGWNPDLNGIGYQRYVGDLIKLASFHDEYDTNNIWRSMTHEAIKNLDWTFTKIQGETVDEMETIDTSRVEPILKVYGRQYDDIKRQIDNIGKSSTVTLNKKNNVPDYFLDDVLQLSGWETKTVNLDEEGTVVTPSLYGGMTLGYDAVDADNEFFRRLKVCSPYLFSLKGTVQGLKTLLGLFGLSSSEYSINEYIVVASGVSGSYPSFEEVAKANRYKYSYMESENNPLLGLPLMQIESSAGNYVIPWYDKSQKYDNGLYFQMKGGWGAHEKDGKVVFDETVSDLKIVGKVEELIELGRYVVKSGDICYATDITGLSDLIGSSAAEGASHYFLLVDDEYVNSFGAVTTEDGGTSTGWTTITEAEIENETTDVGKRVNYLETIIDNNKGNNPHTGHGRYDRGQSYIEQMLNPFKYSVDNNLFIDDEHKAIAESCKFNGDLDGIIDNQKCWFFANREENKLRIVSGSYTRDTSLVRTSFYNPETYGYYDEAAGDSVINIKKLTIDFTCPVSKYKEEYKHFIEDKVLFYLRQMIPATALFEYSIN